MSIPVDLTALGETLRDFDDAYLVTVTERARAHVVGVTPVVRDDCLEIGGLGRHTLANAAARPEVTLAWPPRERGGYTLIADGHAEQSATGLTVTLTRAVLHRAAPEREPTPGDACASDCVEVPLTAEGA